MKGRKQNMSYFVVLWIAAAATVGHFKDSNQYQVEAMWEDMYTIEVQDPVTGEWGQPDSTYIPPVPTDRTKQKLRP